MKTAYQPIQLAIIDDDVLVSKLLNDYFTKSNDIHVVYIANSGNQFLEYIKNTDILPDVILLDLRMTDGTGLDVLHELSKNKTSFKIIVLSTFYNESFIGQMLKLGCDAFIPKDIDPDDLIYIIKIVYKNGHYFSEDQIAYLRKQISSKSPQLHIETKNALSSREMEVLELLCTQLTAREIAERMFISVKTVEMHKSNLLLKTGVKNAVGLIIYAIQNKLIDPNSLILLD